MNNQKTVLVFSDGMLYSVEGYLAEKIRRAIDAINRPKTVPSKEASSLNRKCGTKERP